jgi:excisionase family DNA binding protein
MTENILTVEEVAKRLRVSHQTVRKLIEEKKLEAFRVGFKWRITEEALERFIQRKEE